MSERVFLDANILVSAAWRPESGLLALWALSGVALLTSAYAIVEADQNVRTSDQRTRLHRLAQQLEIVDEPTRTRLPVQVRLPAKDVPILMAAIEASANYLLAGDRDHFGEYFGKTIEGVRILRPAAYLTLRRSE